LGKALHNAMQVFQMRAELAEALEFGEAALAYLEKEYAEPASPADAALMGRLYFRLGLINVKRDQNHSAAVAWFEKAIPLLDRPMPKEVVGDLGRYGEMFVSMGIAYWEVGQREDGVKLTQKGIAIIERGVQQNLADQSTLAVPYHNLATMYRKLGTTDLADHFQDMASRIKSEKLK
jgi:tetratricopeptide (TPR) repeat protein